MMDNKIIKDLVNKMLEAMQKEAGAGWMDIRSVSEEFKNSQAARLQQIMELRIAGDLNDAQYEQRLDHERKVTEAELNALQVMTKGTVQKSVNAAFAVFEKALIKLLGIN